ncbi:MAG: amino acid transporter [Chloroflexia bacterium]|nr:amino acid transporter [Chloroflexia bacterium]
MPAEDQLPWVPLTFTQVASLFTDLTVPWWLAGGHAISAVVGRPYRRHDDIDVLVLRRDQAAVRSLLRAWDCWMADPPGTLRRWPVDALLPPAAHDVWCREHAGGPWKLQLMFDEHDPASGWWRSRRDPRITRPLATLTAPGTFPLPVLAPEIQLWYKAKQPRPKDALDLAMVLPALSVVQRAWLRQALRTTYGPTHPWFGALNDTRLRPR